MNAEASVSWIRLAIVAMVMVMLFVGVATVFIGFAMQSSRKKKRRRDEPVEEHIETRLPVARPIPEPVSELCPGCGAMVPPGSPQGLCPRCLLKQVMAPSTPFRTMGMAPVIPPSPEEVSRFLPHLEIRGLIGQGGMGAVYLARQPALDRLVALKLIHLREDDPTFTERFSREARAMARLSHPNIVTVYESGEAGGLPYLIMEYVDGVSLRDAMRERRLTPGEILTLIPQVCEALEYAHRQGVVHRDIKPDNILIDRTGKVKIADFGLAKLADTAGVSLTRTAQAMGTLHYMAPEQWERPTEVDHRADIYALGVMLYELLTGELPLGRFDPPSVKAQVDARIDELVLRALAKEPDRRYQHASDVQHALEKIHVGGGWQSSREFRSRKTFLGWPLVHVVRGKDPQTGKLQIARGWIAVSDYSAIGGIAVAGVKATGIIAVSGVISIGVFSIAGATALGAFAAGGEHVLGGTRKDPRFWTDLKVAIDWKYWTTW